jgi:UDP-N-acetylmuramoyl-tripeptide--D-alanyl-D-alanine ligase
MSSTAAWQMILEDLVAGSEGKVLSQNERVFKGVGTDTRADLKGKIFIALKGDAFDAHDFLVEAADAGAAALLVHRLPDSVKALLNRVTVIEVADTLKSLQSLGNFWRGKLGREAKSRGGSLKILGITGTNGKTTTKEFAAAIIGSKFRVQYSKGSFNNHWGVPISLLSIDSSHEVALIEMGMNHPGELKELVAIAEPDAVMVTMVGRGHLEGVGSIEGVAKAKSEIYQYSSANATRIFNLENEQTRQMREKFSSQNIICFTGFEHAKKSGQLPTREGKVDIALEVSSSTSEALHLRGEIRGVKGEADVPVFGSHNVTNLMAAAALGLVCGMTPAEIWSAFPLSKMAWGRNQWVDLKSGARVLFDAYNANPESMRAAIDNFAHLSAPSGGRKFAVLAEMRELGEQTPALHRELGERAALAGFAAIAFIGPSGASFKAGLESGGFLKNLFISDTYENALAAQMLPVLNPNDIVLMKGSRGMQLEKALKDMLPLNFQSKN